MFGHPRIFTRSKKEEKMARHYKGGKFTASHTTVIEPAEPVVRVAVKHEAVTKISLGLIQRIPSKKARLKFTDVPAGFKLTVIGMGSMQDFVIFTADREGVKAALQEAYSR